MLDTPHTSSQARAEKDDKIIGGIDNLVRPLSLISTSQ